MLTGLAIGVFVGLAIALAVALFINFSPSPFVKRTTPPETPAATKPAPAAEAQPAAKPAEAAAKTPNNKPRFDFYTILPGTEEPVTEQEIKQAGAQNSKDQYFLQAGSFQTEAEADNLKAKLALLGMEAVIQTASLPDTGVWHRVRVGPFSNVQDLDKARASLAQNGVQASLVKVHDTPH